MTDIVDKLRETGSDLADDAADEIDRLRAFVVWALSEGAWKCSLLDGGEIQDKAIELGLVVKTKYDNAIHGEDDVAQEGDDWFRARVEGAMTDLVERLRNVQRDWDPRLSILTEAADEIEKLREALQRIDNINDDPARYNPGINNAIEAGLGKWK